MAKKIDMNLITAGSNDRKTFDAKKLAELADSIKSHGLIQPVTVRPVAAGFQIVAGERRFRAAALLGWQEIEANIVDLTDEETAAVMLAENVARQDLDPIEEAAAYQERVDKFGWSISDVAKKVGVSTIRVKFRIKLLALRPDVQDLVKFGGFPIGYAQILADAQLSDTFQSVAMRRFLENPKPTTPWFRRVCGELASSQNQTGLFTLPIMGGPLAVVDTMAAETTPPTPSDTRPPTTGGEAKEQIKFQISFWNSAAQAWQDLGKPFKRQECEAAARALTYALSAL